MATYIPESRLESVATRSRLLTDSSASIVHTATFGVCHILSSTDCQNHTEMWLRSLLLVVLSVECIRGLPDPGLLRVPKVYNAVITSNQNLAPSRAYPVIQPVVHRTAIGYVPPYYYTQIAPGFAGPGVVQLEPGSQPTRPKDAESVETPEPGHSGTKTSTKRISRPSSTRENQNDDFSDEETSAESTEQNPSSSSGKGTNKKGNNDDRIPLNFYPNYRSVYYGPYFNPYNAFPPNLATPGTYYVDYPQPPGLLGPLPPPPLPLQPGPPIIPILPGNPTSNGGNDDRESTTRRSEKQKSRTYERREKIAKAASSLYPISTGKETS